MEPSRQNARSMGRQSRVPGTNLSQAAARRRSNSSAPHSGLRRRMCSSDEKNVGATPGTDSAAGPRSGSADRSRRLEDAETRARGSEDLTDGAASARRFTSVRRFASAGTPWRGRTATRSGHETFSDAGVSDSPSARPRTVTVDDWMRDVLVCPSGVKRSTTCSRSPDGVSRPSSRALVIVPPD
jgi:hypothetical protein